MDTDARRTPLGLRPPEVRVILLRIGVEIYDLQDVQFHEKHEIDYQTSPYGSELARIKAKQRQLPQDNFFSK